MNYKLPYDIGALHPFVKLSGIVLHIEFIPADADSLRHLVAHHTPLAAFNMPIYPNRCANVSFHHLIFAFRCILFIYPRFCCLSLGEIHSTFSRVSNFVGTMGSFANPPQRSYGALRIRKLSARSGHWLKLMISICSQKYRLNQRQQLVHPLPLHLPC